MATYVFDGTTDLEIANFRPALDTVIINGVDIEDVASFTESDETVTLTLTTGVMLSLGGTTFSSLNADNFEPAGGSDIVFDVGAAATGNLIIGTDSTVVGAGDTLTPTTDGSFVYGLAGNDTVDATSFADVTIYAGQGDDSITVDGGLVFGNNGADGIVLNVADGDTATVFGGSDVVGTTDGIDNIDGSGSDGNLLIYGNAGADIIVGGTGDDTIFGGADNDDIDGGAGDNMLYGNLGDDSIAGGTGDSTILGGQGDDSLTGGDGDEAIYGNLDNDIIITSTGVDLLHGGAGDDSIGSAVDPVTGDVTTGNLVAGSSVYGGLGEDVINVTVVTGAAGAETSIFGGNNLVGAADGDDSITVLGTVDASVYGNEGNDTIVGGEASNLLVGGMGNDSLTGGSAEGEVTTVTGGMGDDVFVAQDITTALVAGNDIGYSLVSDFTKGSDTIEFSTDPTAFATVVVGAATSFDSVQGVITAYEGQIGANGALAVVVQAGELAGETVLLHATTAGTADQVIVLTGAQNGLDLSDFT